MQLTGSIPMGWLVGLPKISKNYFNLTIGCGSATLNTDALNSLRASADTELISEDGIAHGSDIQCVILSVGTSINFD